MSKAEAALKWMVDHANDPKCGYDQIYRWGEMGDWDCSSAVITAWESAGVPVKTNGATYTGNIRSVFLKCGFKDVTRSVNRDTGKGLLRGDVLLNEVHHVAMYVGGGMEVEASINEKGTATGGKPGDQTGKEFKVRSYRNYPWDCVLRYSGDVQQTASYPSCTVSLHQFVGGAVHPEVRTIQILLSAAGYKGKTGKPLDIDGELGPETQYALSAFQKDAGMRNINFGTVASRTWELLLK